MTPFSVSTTQLGRMLDPIQCRDRAQTIRSRYIRQLARLMLRRIYRGEQASRDRRDPNPLPSIGRANMPLDNLANRIVSDVQKALATTR